MRKFIPRLEILPSAQRRLWLAGTKASLVQLRSEAKDYLDLDAMITNGGISLPMALTAGAALYGASFNPQITLKALSYFEDGNLHTLPEGAKLRLMTAAREVNLDRLPSLKQLIGDKRAPPGIIDPRSWAYWNSKMGRYPPPPLPVRRLGNVVGPDKMDFVQEDENRN